MNVLLIATNRFNYPYYVLPIGLSYLGTYLKKQNNEVSILDLCFLEDNEVKPAIIDEIKKFKPDIIGLNVRNYCTFMDDPPLYFLPFIKEVAQICNKNSQALIVLGGGAFSNDAEHILKYTGVDHGIRGEAELSFSTLLDKYKNKEQLCDVSGLIYRENGKFIKNEIKFVENIDILDSPDRDFYDKQYYLKRSELGLKTKESIITSRGCPFDCIYCFNPNFYRRKFALRSPKNVVKEIKQLIKRGIYEFDFINFAFNLPKGHAEDICKEIIKENLKIKWSAEIHPYPIDAVERELFSLFKEAGCQHISFDTVTCSDKVAKALKRPGFSREAILKASSYCHEYQIPFSHHLIIGGPEEDRETIVETLTTIEETNPTGSPKVIANVGVILGNNTKLSKLAVEEGIIEPDDNLLFPPRFYMSPKIKQDSIDVIHAFRKRYNDWLFVGMTLQKSLGAIEDEDWDKDTIIPKMPIQIGKIFPQVALYNLEKKIERLDLPSNKTVIILFDSRASAREAFLWKKKLIEKYASEKEIDFKIVSAVDPLRFFVSKNYIAENVRRASGGTNHILDWDQKVAKLIGINNFSKPWLIVVKKNVFVDMFSLDPFLPEELENINRKIEKLS